ncbi:Sensor protein PA2656 [hydrothermal vent metagenome]|uniref:histidine kinase n=1 Tax=hydrothermal vent metagenome TaxID=652676 RepID=A0A3B1B4B3_9ZZZZ
MKVESLQLRLGLGLLLSLIAVFIILWFLISHSIRSLTEDYVLSHLQHDTETLLAKVHFDDKKKPLLDKTKLDVIYQRPFSGHYYQINQAGTPRLRSRSLWDQDLEFNTPISGQAISLHTIGPEQQPLLLYVASYIKSGARITIAVAEDLSPIEHDVERFQHYFALAALLAFLGLLTLQRWLLKYSFQPLEKLKAEVQKLERGSIDKLSQNVPTEIKPLVVEVNLLLSLMAERLQRSRNTLGDLAHALKTPLTLLRQLAEDESLSDNDHIKKTLSLQTDKMLRLISHSLKRARLAGEGPAGSTFSIHEDIAALLDTLQHMHKDKQFEFIPSETLPDRLPLDREDMLELLGNLLDNAGKWARQHIRFTLCINENKLRCTIEDDGPGVDQTNLKLLTRRGLRLDENADGHGLGLSIVKDIIHQYSGNIHFSKSGTTGGLQVSFEIPLSGRASVT